MPSSAGHFIFKTIYQMKKELLDVYIKMIAPLIIIIAVLYIAKLFTSTNTQPEVADRSIAIIVFILSAAFSIALPILYRTTFVNKIKDQKEVPINEFLSFEKKLIYIAMVAPYFICAAIILNIGSFYFTAIILFGFYSIYYYYPSNKRIKFEKKLFRIKSEDV